MDDKAGQDEGRRLHAGRMVAVALLVIALGLGAGIGLNVLIADPGTGKTTKTKPKTPANQTKQSAPASSSTSSKRVAMFDVNQALSHTYALSEQIGPRPAGSGKESAAGNYIAQRLAEFGYNVEEQPFTLPAGYADRNIIATRSGTKDGYSIVLAAHYDSAAEAKGPVNNASGVGVLLELARDFSKKRLAPKITFAFLGANRPGVSDISSRLLGARRYVDLLGTLDKKDVVGMISLDCVCAGDVLALRTQETGLQRLKDKLATYAQETDVPVQMLKASDDSDNIPFEDSKIPATWIEWCTADGSIVPGEAYTLVVPAKEAAVGKLVEGFLLDLTTDDLEELKY